MMPKGYNQDNKCIEEEVRAGKKGGGGNEIHTSGSTGHICVTFSN